MYKQSIDVYTIILLPDSQANITQCSYKRTT